MCPLPLSMCALGSTACTWPHYFPHHPWGCVVDWARSCCRCRDGDQPLRCNGLVWLCGLVAQSGRLLATLGAQHALSPPRGCLCRHRSPYGGDLAEERGLGRGLGLRRALSGRGGTAGCGCSRAGSEGRSLPGEQGTHRGRIRPWHRALVARRAQRRGTWHPVLAVHPRRGCHRPAVPAAVLCVCVCVCSHVCARTPAPEQPARGVLSVQFGAAPGPRQG